MKKWKVFYSTGETKIVTAKTYTMAYLNGMSDGLIIIYIKEV